MKTLKGHSYKPKHAQGLTLQTLENTKVHSYKSKHAEGLILQTLGNTKVHSYKSKHEEGLTLLAFISLIGIKEDLQVRAKMIFLIRY